jgi:hypothetical protein
MWHAERFYTAEVQRAALAAAAAAAEPAVISHRTASRARRSHTRHKPQRQAFLREQMSCTPSSAQAALVPAQTTEFDQIAAPHGDDTTTSPAHGTLDRSMTAAAAAPVLHLAENHEGLSIECSKKQSMQDAKCACAEQTNACDGRKLAEQPLNASQRQAQADPCSFNDRQHDHLGEADAGFVEAPAGSTAPSKASPNGSGVVELVACDGSMCTEVVAQNLEGLRASIEATLKQSGRGAHAFQPGYDSSIRGAITTLSTLAVA